MKVGQLGTAVSLLCAMQGCRHSASIPPLPAELSAFAAHLSKPSLEDGAQGTTFIIYDVDLSIEDAYSALDGLLPKEGWTTRGIIGDPQFRLAPFKKPGRPSIILSDDANPKMRLPGRGRVTLTWQTAP